MSKCSTTDCLWCNVYNVLWKKKHSDSVGYKVAGLYWNEYSQAAWGVNDFEYFLLFQRSAGPVLLSGKGPGKRRSCHLRSFPKHFPPVSSFSLFISLSLPTCPLSLYHISADTPKPPAKDRLIMPDEFELPGRAKRSPITSNKVGGLNVETLVVADRKMLEKHGRENVTTYVLTVMNMVSRGGTPVSQSVSHQSCNISRSRFS